MRRALPLTFTLLLCTAGAQLGCSEDEPEPGFTQTGGNGGAAPAAGGAAGGQGGGGQGGAAAGGGGAPGGPGGGGPGGGGGQGGVCGDDANEPNDGPVQATRLDGGGDGRISDCEGDESTNGLLEGEGDEDWFVFTGVDSGCGLDDIQPHVKFVPATAFAAEVCIFVKPITPATDPAVCAGGGDANSELDGYVGCCGTAEARATVGANFQADETDVRIRVSKLSGALCGGYTITYGNNAG